VPEDGRVPIGELARPPGVTTSVLRYYERIDLRPPAELAGQRGVPGGDEAVFHAGNLRKRVCAPLMCASCRLERPDQSVLPGAVVEQRIGDELLPERPRHRVELDRRAGGLQRPRWMADVRAQRSAPLVDHI
jgi:MerR family regulatory protein